MRLRLPAFPLGLCLVFIAYAATARAGLLLGAVSGFATFVWPPTGIALAALLAYGYRLWPGIFLAALLVNYVTGAPLFVAAGIALGNTLEAAVGAFLLRSAKLDTSLERLSDILALVGYAALASTLVSATIGVSSLWAGGTLSLHAIGPTWVAWWVGDILGDLVAFPFVLVLIGRLRFKIDKTQYAEMLALALFLACTSLVTFSNLTTAGSVAHTSLAYLLFLPLIWAALRFDQATVATAIVSTSALAITGTVLGVGPFAQADLSQSLFALQLFMGTMAMTSLIMGVVAAERRRSIEALREQVTEDEALIESIGDGVIAVDPEGRVLKTNTRARAMLGWGARQIVGVDLAAMLEIKDERGTPVPHELRPVRTVLSSRERVTTDRFSYVRQDGSSFPAAITVAPIMFAGRFIGAIEVFRDTTSEREIEQAKSDFIALVSHQLRTPLTIASWYSERLRTRQGEQLDPKSRADLAEVERSIHQMIQLVNDILHVSLLESGELKIEPIQTHLGQFLQQVIREFDPLVHEKTCHIQYEERGPIALTLVDPDLMREILYNLLSNAVRYSRGQHCDIRVSLSPGSGIHSDAYVIAVEDHGIGIAAKDRPRIFEKFFRTASAKNMSSNGSGLGLYLVREIARAAGVEVWVESEEGIGSTFFVAIPTRGMNRRSGEQFSKLPPAVLLSPKH